MTNHVWVRVKEGLKRGIQGVFLCTKIEFEGESAISSGNFLAFIEQVKSYRQGLIFNWKLPFISRLIILKFPFVYFGLPKLPRIPLDARPPLLIPISFILSS